jgi:hypothetical protein
MTCGMRGIMKRLLLIAGLACGALGRTTVLTHATVIDGTG